MRMDELPPNGFSNGDMMLIAEAVRRALAQRCNQGVPRDRVIEAVLAEARRGTRTMFGLVKAASNLARAAG